MTWILTRLGDEPSQAFIIDRDMVVGRHANADIILDSQEVSRKHAGIGLNDAGIYVVDLGSANGTFINNETFSGEYQLKAGDTIRFAHIEFRVSVQENNTDVSENNSTNNEQQNTAQQTTADNHAIENNTVDNSIAQQMNEQGMPSLTERAQDIQVSREGMPQNISIPKPAPIPEGVDVNQPQPVAITEQDKIPSDIEQDKEEKKSAKVGLISIIVLIILAIIAWVALK